MGEEVCEENFEKQCSITFKQQAFNETVKKCYTPLIKECNGQGPEECRTVYESSCTTKYIEKQPGKFVGDTACEKLPVEICGAGCVLADGDEECHDKVLTSLVDVPEEICDLNPQKTCRYVTKLVPRLKPESPMMKPMLSENPSVLVLRTTLSSPCPATKLPPCTTLPLPDSNWEGSLHLGIINEALVKIPKPGVMCASQHLSTHTSVTHTIMPTYLFIYFSSIYLYSFSIY